MHYKINITYMDANFVKVDGVKLILRLLPHNIDVSTSSPYPQGIGPLVT